MPELPEVETIRRRLAEVIIGQKIVDIEILRPKCFQGVHSDVVGAVITSVTRRAKVLVLELDTGLSILIHLKMTGQVIVVSGGSRVGGGHPTADWVRTLPSSHTRVVMHFADQSTQLFFNDQRVFGWMKVVDDAQKQLELSHYGPDINTPAVDSAYFWHGLRRTSRPIKVKILDGSFVAGIGNIYACDALNLAKISPQQPSNSLSRDQSDRLLVAAKQVIERGIELHGTTFDGSYVGVDGFAGGYQNEILVYGRHGEPCHNCGALIEKMTLAGRGTYYCPVCQRLELD